MKADVIPNDFRQPLIVHSFYIILCVAWNAIGLLLLSNGQQPIGPTASAPVIATLLGFLGLLIISANKRWRLPYLLISSLLLFAAVSAIVGGFTKSADFWPSEFWRYAGIVLNLIGVVSFFIAFNALRNSKH